MQVQSVVLHSRGSMPIALLPHGDEGSALLFTAVYISYGGGST